MELYEALELIAKHADLDYVELAGYAAEDTVGGRHAGFDDWSIDANEGKLLYALVRALKPAQAIEIGVRQGASTEHLLTALALTGGRLDSYDIEPANVKHLTGWTYHQGDALVANFPAADFIFEDSDHGLQYSLELFEKLRALNPHMLVTHDYAMTTAHGDFFVKEAFDSVFPEGFGITLDGCERGLGVWVNLEWRAPEAPRAAAKPRTRRSKTTS